MLAVRIAYFIFHKIGSIINHSYGNLNSTIKCELKPQPKKRSQMLSKMKFKPRKIFHRTAFDYRSRKKNPLVYEQNQNILTFKVDSIRYRNNIASFHTCEWATLFEKFRYAMRSCILVFHICL